MQVKNSLHIRKANGEVVPFYRDKLIASLRKSGAKAVIADEIANEIEAELVPGMSTRSIYKKAFKLLRKESRHLAARYKLKKAILELGESGYPFEKFVAALLEAEGFETQVGLILHGVCVDHEVDVVAQKGDLQYLVECKFHNSQDRLNNVKLPLYIDSRFRDIVNARKSHPEYKMAFHQGWIFTNTRFTEDARQYGECAGLKLVGWDLPKGQSIKERIDKTGVHPITSVTSLTNKEKQALIELDIITCRQLVENPGILHKIGIEDRRFTRMLQEVQQVCTIL